MSSNLFPPQYRASVQLVEPQGASKDVSQEQENATGPLTGRDVEAPVQSARVSSSSSRRSRKSASAFKTISEVADVLDVQQHVLRFWETKFSQVRPLKRGGGRRYYRPEDLSLLQKIHHLLYTEGYTIKGVQKLLREQGKKAVLDGAGSDAHAAAEPANTQNVAPASSSQQGDSLNAEQRRKLESVLSDLKELRGIVSPE